MTEQTRSPLITSAYARTKDRRFTERILEELALTTDWPETVNLIGYTDTQVLHLASELGCAGYEFTDPGSHGHYRWDGASHRIEVAQPRQWQFCLASFTHESSTEDNHAPNYLSYLKTHMMDRFVDGALSQWIKTVAPIIVSINPLFFLRPQSSLPDIGLRDTENVIIRHMELSIEELPHPWWDGVGPIHLSTTSRHHTNFEIARWCCRHRASIHQALLSMAVQDFREGLHVPAWLAQSVVASIPEDSPLFRFIRWKLPIHIEPVGAAMHLHPGFALHAFDLDHRTIMPIDDIPALAIVYDESEEKTRRMIRFHRLVVSYFIEHPWVFHRVLETWMDDPDGHKQEQQEALVEGAEEVLFDGH